MIYKKILLILVAFLFSANIAEATNGLVEIKSEQVPCLFDNNSFHQVSSIEGGEAARNARIAQGCPEPPTTGGCEIVLNYVSSTFQPLVGMTASEFQSKCDGNVKLDRYDQYGNIADIEYFTAKNLSVIPTIKIPVTLDETIRSLIGGSSENKCPSTIACEDRAKFALKKGQISYCSPSKVVTKCLSPLPNGDISSINVSQIQTPIKPEYTSQNILGIGETNLDKENLINKILDNSKIRFVDPANKTELNTLTINMLKLIASLGTENFGIINIIKIDEMENIQTENLAHSQGRAIDIGRGSDVEGIQSYLYNNASSLKVSELLGPDIKKQFIESQISEVYFGDYSNSIHVSVK